MHSPNVSKLSKARAGLVLDHPFWGALSLRPRLLEDRSSRLGWTDGATIGYNPEAIAKLSLGQSKTFLAHEAGGHVGLAHHARRGSRNARRWNRACDYVVNGILADCGFEPIPGWLHDPQFAGMSSDQVYALLPTEPGDDEPGSDPDPGGCGEVRDAPAPDGGQPTPADLAQAEAEAKVAVAQAAQAAKACGKLPAALARLVEEMLEPHVPWREVLRRFVDQAARDDYTWRRPNRRYLASGLYLPSLYSEDMRPIVLAVDTSGSIAKRELDQFAAEMTAILGETGASATVIYCDAAVSGVEEFTPEDLPLKLSPRGGGGTDFRPPFGEVETRGLTPSCAIYLTDGECSSFPEPPEYPVLWAVTGRKFAPPFGEVVEVRND